MIRSLIGFVVMLGVATLMAVGALVTTVTKVTVTFSILGVMAAIVAFILLLDIPQQARS